MKTFTRGNFLVFILIAVIFLISCKKEEEDTSRQCNSNNVVVDVDGNVYPVIQIGEQCWMGENLRVSRYNNTHIIPNNTNAWFPNTQYYGAAASYNGFGGDSADLANYGRLYNWYTVKDSRGLCPKGWHVPSDAEWQVMIQYLGGEAVAGGKLKDTATGIWDGPNSGASNTAGFGARAGGYRAFGTPAFYRMGLEGYYWTTTTNDGGVAFFYMLSKDSISISRKGPLEEKGVGRSCRCVRDTI